jgi:hypothetical protein
MTVEQPRPLVNVSNAALAGEWLRENIGSPTLSGYFIRGDDIVHIPREGADGYVEPSSPLDSDGPAQVRAASPGHIAATVNWQCWPYKQKDSGSAPVPSRFAVEVARDAVARPDLCSSLRSLRGVTHTPIVRADGSILSVPGYDASSGFYHLPAPDLFVPWLPVRTDTVSWAVSLLSSVISDFPWRSADDRANYLGMMLTPLLRLMVPPPYKLGIITAPQPASGKTLLARILHIVHGGVFRSEIPRDDAELKKQITSILVGTTAPVVTFDNVSGTFRSSVIDGLLTSDVWTDRVLGATEETSRPNDRFWTITGNNVGIGGDLARRSLWASIDADRPDPENRPVVIGDLPEWVRSRRGGLIAALLMLVRAWTEAGRPMMPTASSDGFAHWTSVVGGILANAGIEGTFAAETTRQGKEADDDLEWRDLLRTIYAVKGSAEWTAREILEYRELAPIDPANAMLGATTRYPVAEALPADLAVRAERNGPASVARSFGMWLRNRAGRWAGGLTVRESKLSTKAAKWYIEQHGQVGLEDYEDYSPLRDAQLHKFNGKKEVSGAVESPTSPSVLPFERRFDS